MEIFEQIASRCTTKEKIKEEVVGLLKYIYETDISLPLALEELNKIKGCLTVNGLHKLLIKRNKKEMISFSKHLQVKKFLGGQNK